MLHAVTISAAVEARLVGTHCNNLPCCGLFSSLLLLAGDTTTSIIIIIIIVIIIIASHHVVCTVVQTLAFEELPCQVKTSFENYLGLAINLHRRRRRLRHAALAGPAK